VTPGPPEDYFSLAAGSSDDVAGTNADRYGEREDVIMTMNEDFGSIAGAEIGSLPAEEMLILPTQAPDSGSDDDLGTLVGDAENIGATESGDLGAEINADGVSVSDVISALDDLESGNYVGAVGEGASIGLNVGGAALGLPGINGDASVISDLIDGNTGGLEGDAEKAAIETATSIALAAAGSVLGPVGTVVGGAVGDFVGDAIAPSVEDAVSDTYDTGADLVDDTVSSFEDAGDDLSDGDVFDAAGDVAEGAFDDVGDVLSGAVDLTGDALEGVDDLATQTVGAVDDVASGVEDVATSAVDDVEDVATSAVDDVGDAVSSAVDDIEDLF